LAALLTDVAACLLGLMGIGLALMALRRADQASVRIVTNSCPPKQSAPWPPSRQEGQPSKASAAAGGDPTQSNVALAARIVALEQKVEELRGALANRERGLVPLGEDLPASPRPEPPPVFPATIDDLRERFGPGTKVAWKPVTGLLHEDPAGDADSVVEIEGNLVYLPGRGRMASAADYRTYFERFFTCGAPSRGTVEVTLPALVERAGDRRFKLIRQGEIRIQ